MSTATLRVTDPRTTSVSVPRLPGVDVGCDVVEVARVAGLLTRWPQARERLFTAGELAASTRDGVPADDPAAMRRRFSRAFRTIFRNWRTSPPSQRWLERARG